MAAYPVLTADNLAEFSGRPVEDYTDYAEQAIFQATLLFQVGTCLGDELPDEGTTGYKLAVMALTAMAEAITAVQPYQEVLSNPFSSETIGSYSYSKLNSAVAAGLPTGVSWFDLAVANLSVCNLDDNSGSSSGGIEIFNMGAAGSADNYHLLGPSDDWGGDYLEDPSQKIF